VGLLRWLILLVLFYLIWRVLKGLIQPGRRPTAGPDRGSRPEKAEDLIQDPVSGVYFPRSQGVASKVEGKVLYFVNTGTRDEYHRRRTGTGPQGGKP
jgi:hypothetical protein